MRKNNYSIDENPHITGIDGEKLVDLILKYYEHMDEGFKEKINLKKVYVPEIDMEE